MPGVGEKHCVYCRRPERDAGRLSYRGICMSCATARVVANAEQLERREGEHYTHWRRRLSESLERLVPSA